MYALIILNKGTLGLLFSLNTHSKLQYFFLKFKKKRRSIPSHLTLQMNDEYTRFNHRRYL